MDVFIIKIAMENKKNSAIPHPLERSSGSEPGYKIYHVQNKQRGIIGTRCSLNKIQRENK
jgi:hypothetical protein